MMMAIARDGIFICSGADDKGIQNIINSSYAVIMELPECITDYDSFLKIWDSLKR